MLRLGVWRPIHLRRPRSRSGRRHDVRGQRQRRTPRPSPADLRDPRTPHHSAGRFAVMDTEAVFPTPLTAYPPPAGSLAATLQARVEMDPFNLVVTGIFVLAIVHTFAAARFTRLAHAFQHRHDARARARGRPARPSVRAELLHFLGEVEVVFGLWAVVLIAAIAMRHGWATATHYINDTV